MMLRRLPLVLCASALAALTTACNITLNRDGGEGEGEGEGEEGEGEGEGEEGVGEGEEGEGEGEEGEGEGEEGEGEGEGEEEPVVDEAGGVSDPVDVTLPFNTTVSINPADDLDCFRFTTTATQLVTVAATGACENGGGDPLARLFVDGGDELVNDDDDGPAVCPLIETVVEAGTYVACVQHYSLGSVIRDLAVAISTAPVTTLSSGAPCDTASLTAICDPEADLECLLTAVGPDTFSCATRRTLTIGATCTPGVQDAVCDGSLGLACVDLTGGGRSTCIDAVATACEAPQAITGTTLSGTIPARRNLLRSSCDFESRSEKVLSYTVQNPIANVSISLPFPAGLALSVREECTDALTEVGCVAERAATVVRNSLAAGTVLTIIVEGDDAAAFTVNVIEQPHTLLDTGDTCSLTSTTQSCDPRVAGLACVGPLAGPFQCAVPDRLNSGEACVVGATNAVCDAAQSLACRVGATPGEGVCATLTTAVELGDLTATDPTWVRPDASCGPDGTSAAVPFDSFVITNNDAQASRVTIFESAVRDLETCAADLFLHVFDGAVDAANPVSGCIDGNDDGGPGTCGQLVDIELPASGSVTAVVSTYSSAPRLPIAYQLNVIGFGRFTVAAR